MREQYEQSVPEQDSNLRPTKKSEAVRHSLYSSVTRSYVLEKRIVTPMLLLLLSLLSNISITDTVVRASYRNFTVTCSMQGRPGT
jgi:hypothetical protein